MTLQVCLFVCFPLSFGSFYGRHASILPLLLVSLVLLLGPTDDANRLFVLRFLFVLFFIIFYVALPFMVDTLSCLLFPSV